MARHRPTSRDVAQRAGVSRSTVSFVLNDVPGINITAETRQRVLDAARELNYYPDVAARSLASGKTRTIALVWHRGPNREYRDAFLPAMLQGIAGAAQQSGYFVLFRPIKPDDPDDGYVALARGRHTDGLIFSGPRSDDSYLIDLHADGFPIVLHGQLPGTDIPSVDVDNEHSAAMAMEHLISLGHRRIGMITNAPIEYTASRQRLEGYRRALDQAGLPFDAKLVAHGNFDADSGRRAMTELLAQHRLVTAVFVASDVVALGAVQAIRQHGWLVPDDISVIGFDDVAAARFITPALTTVQLPTYALGWTAAERLVRIIEQDELSDLHTVLDTGLVIRDSTSTPPDGRHNHSADSS